MKGRELADKKEGSMKLTEGKGSPVGRVQQYDNGSLRPLLLSPLEMKDSERPPLIVKKGNVSCAISCESF